MTGFLLGVGLVLLLDGLALLAWARATGGVLLAKRRMRRELEEGEPLHWSERRPTDRDP